MLQAYLRIPLRVWVRLGIVASLLWLVITTLWHWTTLGSEMATDYMRHLQVCQTTRELSVDACFLRAGHQLDVSRASIWQLAVGLSMLQLALLWFIGLVLIAGSRWAFRAFKTLPMAA